MVKQFFVVKNRFLMKTRAKSMYECVFPTVKVFLVVYISLKSDWLPIRIVRLFILHMSKMTQFSRFSIIYSLNISYAYFPQKELRGMLYTFWRRHALHPQTYGNISMDCFSVNYHLSIQLKQYSNDELVIAIGFLSSRMMQLWLLSEPELDGGIDWLIDWLMLSVETAVYHA